MFHVAFPRGQGPAFADLPPTLQPHAIAASAPPTDHLRAAAFSGLIYFSLAGGVIALSSLASPPDLIHPPPPPTKPTIVYDPPFRRVTLPPMVFPGLAGGAGPGSTILPSKPSEPSSTEAPAGLPTEDHRLDPVGAGLGTGAIPAGTNEGPASVGTGPGVHDFTTVGLAVLRQVDPVYPEFARKARIQGPVVLMMTVDEQGQPTQVQVLEGHPVFHESARMAARQWRFEPARMNGRPVAATFRLTL